MSETVNGYRVIARSIADADGAHIILAYRAEDRKFVTAWHRPGQTHWAIGHYFSDEGLASVDYARRIRTSLGPAEEEVLA